MKDILVYLYAVIGTVAGVIAVVFAVSLILNIVRSRKARQVIAQRRGSRSFAYELLCAGIGKRYVLRNLRIPSGTKPDGSKAYHMIDIMVINRGGVSIIDVNDQKGRVDNPFKGDWTLTYGNEQFSFHNPFEVNALRVRAVERLMKKENLYNVPISNIVLYTSKNIKFRNSKYQNLLTAEQLIPYMNDLNKNRFMTLSEMNRTLKLMTRFRARPRNASRANAAAVPGQSSGSGK